MDVTGKNPLELAISIDRSDIVEFLLQNIANKKDERIDKALNFAISDHHPEAIEQFVAAKLIPSNMKNSKKIIETAIKMREVQFQDKAGPIPYYEKSSMGEISVSVEGETEYVNRPAMRPKGQSIWVEAVNSTTLTEWGQKICRTLQSGSENITKSIDGDRWNENFWDKQCVLIHHFGYEISKGNFRGYGVVEGELYAPGARGTPHFVALLKLGKLNKAEEVVSIFSGTGIGDGGAPTLEFISSNFIGLMFNGYVSSWQLGWQRIKESDPIVTIERWNLRN